MTDFGLTPHALQLICGVFARHAAIDEVRIFGSRAKGSHRPESDIDLALFGRIDPKVVAAVAGELDELSLPYRFDVQAYGRIVNSALREHIDRVGQVLFSASASSSSPPP